LIFDRPEMRKADDDDDLSAKIKTRILYLLEKKTCRFFFEKERVHHFPNYPLRIHARLHTFKRVDGASFYEGLLDHFYSFLRIMYYMNNLIVVLSRVIINFKSKKGKKICQQQKCKHMMKDYLLA